MSGNYHRLQKRLYEILEPAVYGDKTSRNSDLFFTALVVVNVTVSYTHLRAHET